jgi:hypothetical protein
VVVIHWATPSLRASLMMSSDEVNILDSINPVEEIDSFFEATEIPKLTPSIIEDILFLSAILYINQSHWTVWINEKTYTAEDAENETLKITKVTNNNIEFELKDMTKKIIKLSVNKSLVVVGHRIIDGDARVKSKPVLL